MTTEKVFVNDVTEHNRYPTNTDVDHRWIKPGIWGVSACGFFLLRVVTTHSTIRAEKLDR